jgi:hypothetical protein
MLHQAVFECAVLRRFACATQYFVVSYTPVCNVCASKNCEQLLMYSLFRCACNNQTVQGAFTVVCLSTAQCTCSVAAMAQRSSVMYGSFRYANMTVNTCIDIDRQTYKHIAQVQPATPVFLLPSHYRMPALNFNHVDIVKLLVEY